MNQLAIPVGEYLRDVGITRTLKPEQEWLAQALQSLQVFARQPGWERFKAEDFRAWYSLQGLPMPHSHKVWGGLMSSACKAGIIRFTGDFGLAVSPKTHAHPVRIWSRA